MKRSGARPWPFLDEGDVADPVVQRTGRWPAFNVACWTRSIHGPLDKVHHTQPNGLQRMVECCVVLGRAPVPYFGKDSESSVSRWLVKKSGREAARFEPALNRSTQTRRMATRIAFRSEWRCLTHVAVIVSLAFGVWEPSPSVPLRFVRRNRCRHCRSKQRSP